MVGTREASVPNMVPLTRKTTVTATRADATVGPGPAHDSTSSTPSAR